jgi:hypothetical protein
MQCDAMRTEEESIQLNSTPPLPLPLPPPSLPKPLQPKLKSPPNPIPNTPPNPNPNPNPNPHLPLLLTNRRLPKPLHIRKRHVPLYLPAQHRRRARVERCRRVRGCQQGVRFRFCLGLCLCLCLWGQRGGGGGFFGCGGGRREGGVACESEGRAGRRRVCVMRGRRRSRR